MEISTLDSIKTWQRMARAKWLILMEKFMKVTGRMTERMGEVGWNISQVQHLNLESILFTLENFKRTRNQAKEDFSTLKKMKFTRVSGLMINVTVKAPLSKEQEMLSQQTSEMT